METSMQAQNIACLMGALPMPFGVDHLIMPDYLNIQWIKS